MDSPLPSLCWLEKWIVHNKSCLYHLSCYLIIKELLLRIPSVKAIVDARYKTILIDCHMKPKSLKSREKGQKGECSILFDFQGAVTPSKYKYEYTFFSKFCWYQANQSVLAFLTIKEHLTINPILHGLWEVW